MEPVAPSLPTSPNHGPEWEAVNHASAMALAPSPVYVDMDGDQQANPLATVPEHIDFGANNELRQRHGSIARSRRASVGGGDDVEHFLRARNASVFGKAASFKRPRQSVIVTFSLPRFIRVFLYHLLFPFSVPFVKLIEGDNFLTNMQFVPGYHKAATSKLLFALNSFIFPTSFFAVNLWLHTGRTDPAHGGPFAFEVLMMNIYYVIRCATIALKYAFMGDRAYAQFGQLDEFQAAALQAKMQFLSGWLHPPAALIQEEMLDAAARARIDFNTQLRCNRQSTLFQDIVDTIPPAMAQHLGYTRKGDTLPIGWIGTYVLTKAERGNAFSRVFGAHISRVALVLSAIHSMQPMWQHVEVFQNGQADDILLSVLCFTTRFFMYWVLLAFLQVAVFDYVRAAFASEELYKLISPQTRDTGISHDDVTWEPPVVDIIAPKDARAWYKLRRVLRDTGLRYSLRLQCLVGIVLLLLAVMLVLSFATVFSEGGLNGALQPDVLLTLQLTVFNLVVVAGATLTMIGMGDYANENTYLQIGALVEKEMEMGELELTIRAEMRGPGHVSHEVCKQRMARIHESMATMTQLRRGLKTEDHFHPVMILGIRADRFLLQSLAIGAGSLLALATRVVFSGN